METPNEYQNVLITYKAEVTVPDGHYGRREVQTVTRRAFYSKSKGYYDRENNWIETPDGYYSVPQYWQDFTFSDGTTALLPHTFYSYGKVLPERVIKWEYDNKNHE